MFGRDNHDDDAEVVCVGATSMARPWRPVKPFEMICEVKASSARQAVQEMCEVWLVR